MFRVFIFIIFVQKLFAAPIKISAVSDIDFGTGVPGDPSKTILSGTSENATNGSFKVTGDANRAFSIVLPTAAIDMKFKQGPKTDLISVSGFQSFPSGSSALDSTGARNIFIGATRAALKPNQMAGAYSGTYSVTVVY